MTQPIDRETAIVLAKEAGFKASIGQTVDDKYHPDRNAIGKSVPIEWVQRFYDLAVAHSRKDAEPVAEILFLNGETWDVTSTVGKWDHLITSDNRFTKTALFTHPPEADKLLQQALEYAKLMKLYGPALGYGNTTIDDHIAAIRTYLEGK